MHDDLLPAVDVDMVVLTVFAGVILDPVRDKVKTLDVAMSVNIYNWEGTLRPSVSMMECPHDYPLIVFCVFLLPVFFSVNMSSVMRLIKATATQWSQSLQLLIRHLNL